MDKYKIADTDIDLIEHLEMGYKTQNKSLQILENRLTEKYEEIKEFFPNILEEDVPAEQEEQFENLNDINEAQGRGDKGHEEFLDDEGRGRGAVLNKWIKYTTLFINYKEVV